jgi:HEAT repeat protein
VTKRHSYRTIQMILIISVILSTLISLPAEGREDRRSIEKRAGEIVARFPADNARDRALWAKELIDLGDEGIVAVCRMLASPGASDDSPARFALHGVTTVVNQSGLDRERSLFTKALLRALEQEREKEVQAFLIRQLQLSAGDEAVKPLKGYLQDNRLCDPAAQALLAIATPKAEEALLKSLKDATGHRRVILVRALGEMRSEKAVPLILPFAMGEEAGLRQVSLFALANIGDPAAEAALIRFPLIAPPYDRGRAPSSLLLYARRLGEAGHKKESARFCHQLLNNYTALQESQIACAALTILVDTLGETALGDLLRAMDSPLKDVRGRALELSLTMPGESVTTIWMNEAMNKDLEVLAEIIVMLGLRGDKAAFSMVRGHLSSPDPGIRTAAVTASARLGGLEALPDIWPLLESGDAAEITAIRDVLLGLPAEQVVPQAVARLAYVPPTSQRALIEVLAARRAGESIGYVLALSRSEDEDLRKTALTALERLVRAQDVDRILELMFSAPRRSEIPLIQNALVAAALQAPEPELRAARILEAYEGSAEQQRPDLLRPLARIGGDAAFRLVVKETRNPSDSSIRAAALYALTQWPDIQAADELLILCHSEEHRRYLYQALQGYIRLVREVNLPAAEKAAMLKEILGLPLGTQEKNAIISGLGSVKSKEGLELVSRFLDDPKVRDRAARIMQQIALPEPGAEGLYEPEVVSFLRKAQPFIADEYELRSIEHHITKIMTNDGYIPLFNGKDLSGWMGDTLGYAAEDRKIVVRPESGSGNLYTEKEYANFILRFEFRLTPGANNGLGIRTPPEGDAAYVGMELQILDNSADQYRDLRAYQFHGSIYGVVPAKRGFQRPVGEWNHQEVIARGRRIIVILNGETIVDADLDEASASGTMDGREHPGLGRTRGHIGFLGHGSRVEFRSLWIKELK